MNRPLKIAILGIRGIPNRHGGFDRAAEELSVRLARMGHEVTVYNTDDHPLVGEVYQGVRIRRVFSHEQKLGIFGTFLFDYLCLRDAVARPFDIIFEMGHYPAAVFFPLLRRSQARLVTNIDGLCWKRPKWSKPIRQFILHCEQKAVGQSHALIADHPAIQSYCLHRYGKQAHYIAYGAVVPEGRDTSLLERWALEPQGYFNLVARLEPENNIEMILDGYLQSGSALPFVVVGGLNTQHARHLLARYRGKDQIRFVGAVYDYEALSGLRKHCALYFHGHSVGGTTPSLLEAMACEALVVAHDNPFNRGVLESEARYFSSADDLASLIQAPVDPTQAAACRTRNLDKVRQHYDWDRIAQQHEHLFNQLVGAS